jgi:very-short-patch-repair endonuclease
LIQPLDHKPKKSPVPFTLKPGFQPGFCFSYVRTVEYAHLCNVCKETYAGEPMLSKKNVLVAIVKTPKNLEIAFAEQWYHIPKAQVEGKLWKRWPPEWIAFYQPKSFGEEHRWRIEYAARVRMNAVKEERRIDLFPDEPDDPNAYEPYYKIPLEPPEEMIPPIKSDKGRHIVFIPTTYEKLMYAEEINDLFDESHLEDLLWQAMKAHDPPIKAERQFWIRRVGEDNEGPFRVDFLIECAQTSLVIEVDGPPHDQPDRRTYDAERRNAFECSSWEVLNFTEKHVNEPEARYCIRKINQKVKQLGGYKQAVAAQDNRGRFMRSSPAPHLKRTSKHEGSKPRNQDSSTSHELWHSLREVRRQLAGELNISPYSIFDDRALWQIERSMPRTLDELSRIEGVSEVKARRFGTHFLNELDRFRPANITKRDRASDASNSQRPESALDNTHSNLDQHTTGAQLAQLLETDRTAASSNSEKSYDVAALRTVYAKAYMPWLPKEDVALSEKFREGYSRKELSDIFQRQPGAISSRLRKLGLK